MLRVKTGKFEPLKFLFCRGYYPKGGGEVKVKLSPIKWITPIDMTERGTITKIHGRAFVAGVLPIKVCGKCYKLFLMLHN